MKVATAQLETAVGEEMVVGEVETTGVWTGSQGCKRLTHVGVAATGFSGLLAVRRSGCGSHFVLDLHHIHLTALLASICCSHSDLLEIFCNRRLE